MSKKVALVVDDNPGNVKVLAGLLRLEGVDAVTINDPLRLDAILNGLNQLDVIFLDLEMPNLDGYEVLDMLSNHAKFSDVPVVAYTVHISEINVVRQKGFHSFLGKPLNAEQFPSQLKRILNNEAVWALPR